MHCLFNRAIARMPHKVPPFYRENLPRLNLCPLTTTRLSVKSFFTREVPVKRVRE
jgi:hypothetical protein